MSLNCFFLLGMSALRTRTAWCLLPLQHKEGKFPHSISSLNLGRKTPPPRPKTAHLRTWEKYAGGREGRGEECWRCCGGSLWDVKDCPMLVCCLRCVGCGMLTVICWSWHAGCGMLTVICWLWCIGCDMLAVVLTITQQQLLL